MQLTGEHDKVESLSYRRIMESNPPYIVLNLDLKEPVQIQNFVAAFTGLASQFDKFMRVHHPDLAPDTEIFVREVRRGSIEAELVALAMSTLAALASPMDQVMIIHTFLETYSARIRAYLTPGGRDQTATLSDVRDIMGQVAAIARDPDASSRLEVVMVDAKDGSRRVKAAFKFNTKDARVAEENLARHQLELERTTSADHFKVVMTFKRIDVADAKPGSHTGERVYINSVSTRDLPLIYASGLAEQQIKHHIREAEDNLFKIGFVVDVNVEVSNSGRPRAYRVTNFHTVIDIEDD